MLEQAALPGRIAAGEAEGGEQEEWHRGQAGQERPDGAERHAD